MRAGFDRRRGVSLQPAPTGRRPRRRTLSGLPTRPMDRSCSLQFDDSRQRRGPERRANNTAPAPSTPDGPPRPSSARTTTRSTRSTRSARSDSCFASDVRPDPESELRRAGYAKFDGVTGCLVDRENEVLADHGRWRKPYADPGHRGRGILIMQQVVESVSIERDQSGTRVLFRHPITG